MIRIVPMKRAHIPACDRISMMSEPWKTLNEGIEFERYLTERQSYVCLAGGQIAGFVIFTPGPVFARGGYLRAIAVAADARRQGIGRLLMDFAEAQASRKSLHFYLCVSSFNRRAQAFYRSLGYRKIGAIPDLIKRGESELIYWKKLKRSLRKEGIHR